MVEKFDPVSLLDLMQEERIGYMFMVPTILNAINRIPGIESRRFPDLKCMTVSAAPISDETALKAYAIFGRRHVSGLRPDRGTTRCDDGTAAMVRQSAGIRAVAGLWHAPAVRPDRDLG
jgi:hypothetical protein